MASERPAVDLDARPPVPVDEYAQMVRRVNVGYDLLFTLTLCFLQALDRPDLDLLVVGAAGAEIERFLPTTPTGASPGSIPRARCSPSRRPRPSTWACGTESPWSAGR